MTMQDVLVDNNIAKNFCNPLDRHYKDFVAWLFDAGVLVVTQQLMKEYYATAGHSHSETSITVIVDRLTRTGRLVRFTNATLRDFRFPASVRRKLRSNREDHSNIKAVMLSTRKYAISNDANFRHDVNTYPGHSALAVRRPQDLPYK